MMCDLWTLSYLLPQTLTSLGSLDFHLRSVWTFTYVCASRNIHTDNLEWEQVSYVV